MNISSQYNSALSTSLGGMQQAQRNLQKNASDIASLARPDSNVNLTESVVDLNSNRNAFEANAKVLSTSNDTIGTLLDILA